MQGERTPDWVAEKFAETLDARNQAYGSLVHQAQKAAAESHAQQQKLKEDADRQKGHIKKLLVYTLVRDLAPTEPELKRNLQRIPHKQGEALLPHKR